MKILRILAVTCFVCLSPHTWSFAEKGLEWRELVVLKGGKATVAIDVGGGSIVDFHLAGKTLNPLSWNHPGKGDVEPRPMGHFICFDRWGQPSKGEEERGMKFHGEAPYIPWRVLSGPKMEDGWVTASMYCELPIGGLALERTVKLADDAPVLLVKEVIRNVGRLGRLYNIVQHPSIAPPFLDESVVVDCNAYKGYMQESPWPNPEEPVVYWPYIAYEGKLVDLRRLADDPKPSVTSFVFKDDVEHGWVTAANPGKRLMLGYVWDVSEYPWLNLWRDVEEGRPAARGLEFGTTGLHRPFGDMLKKGTIFGRPLYEYIDAGQEIVKSYVAFLAEIPADYRGVDGIEYGDGRLVIRERESDGSGDIVISWR